MTIEALYPFPGSKADRKYDRHLYPSLTDVAIAEPFAGSCARSLMYCDRLSVYLGEINPAQRAIIQALHNPEAYVKAYTEALERFWDGAAPFRDDVLAYAGKEKAQTALGDDFEFACKALTQNWRSLCSDIYQWMQTGELYLAGYYAFAIRAAFGNVMRLNPKGTHFNVSWHVDKLYQACIYDPQQWIDRLAAMRWNATVSPSWEDAIAAVPDPEKTYLILDPPYWVPGDNEKMTPCYPGHAIGTKGSHEETFDLAVNSLHAGLSHGFKSISVCNYYSDRLDSAIRQLAIGAGYSIQPAILGECNALGNSNGRRKHGKRVDKRDRPVEVIYRIERVPSKIFAVSTPGKVEQLALI